MQASDIMTEKVITASPDDTVLSVVNKMLDNRISAVPVVDAEGRVVGIVSEGDLMNRPETETARRGRPWWLELFIGPEKQAQGFLKTHGTRVSDVMTRRVVTATEDEPAAEIARKLERHRIKRVPIGTHESLKRSHCISDASLVACEQRCDSTLTWRRQPSSCGGSVTSVWAKRSTSLRGQASPVAGRLRHSDSGPRASG